MLSGGAFSRQQFFWCLRHIGGVWVAEIFEFLKVLPENHGRLLEEFQRAGGQMGECRHEERVQLRVPVQPVAVRSSRFSVLKHELRKTC